MHRLVSAYQYYRTMDVAATDQTDVCVARKRKKKRKQGNGFKRLRMEPGVSARPSIPSNSNEAWPDFYPQPEYQFLFGDLDPVDIPGRPSYLPPVYRYKGIHPLRHLHSSIGTSYVYVLDGRKEGNELAYRLSQIAEIPKGSSEFMARIGTCIPFDTKFLF